MNDDLWGLISIIAVAAGIWWCVTNYDIVSQDTTTNAQAVYVDRFKIQKIDYVGTILLDTSTGQTWQYRTLVGSNNEELKDAESRYWKSMPFFPDDVNLEKEWVQSQFDIQNIIDKYAE